MNRDLLLMSLALFTWAFGESAFLAFQPLYLQELGADPVKIGAILSAYGVATALMHIPAGVLSDRIGAKPLLIAGWLVGIAATLVLALARSLSGLAVGIIGYGLTMFVMAPMTSYVTAARGKWSVAQAITLTVAVYYLGAVFGPTLGGLIGERYGFRAIYAVAVGIFILSALLMFNIRAQPVESSARLRVGRELFQNKGFTRFLVVFFVVVFATYLPQPLSPNFLQNERGLSLAQIGLLYSVLSIGIVTANLVLGRFSPRTGFLAGQVAVVAFVLLVWNGTGLHWFVLGYFLLGGFRAARALASAQVRDLVPPAAMGLAYGLVETATGFVTILAPILAGYLYNLKPEWVYAAALGLIGLGMLASAGPFLGRAVRSDEQPIPDVRG